MLYRVGLLKVLTRRRESSGNPWKIQCSPIETSQWRVINCGDKKFFRPFILIIALMIDDRIKRELRIPR